VKINETNSRDIVFREYFATKLCHVFSGEKRLAFVLGKSSGRTNDRSLAQIRLEICENASETPSSQRSNPVVVADQSVNGWIAHIKAQFYSIPDIESIYMAIEENNVDLWLIIPKRNFALLRKIVDLEMQILDDFSAVKHPVFLFEFHVVYRCNATGSQFVPKGSLLIPR
jgi:hypothetical protein